MSHSPIDSKTAGQRNEKLILSLLRKHGSLTQTQLCRLVGIGSSTASTIVARLRDKGLVQESRGSSQRRGPKPSILSLNPKCSYVIGIEINPSYAVIGMFDFVGRLVGKRRMLLGPDHSPVYVIDLVRGGLEGFLREHHLNEDSVLGAGVTLSGSVSSGGEVYLSSPLGWRDVPLRRLLSEYFNFPIVIYSNRVRLLAEIAAAPELATRNILYLNVANGVGSTVYSEGRLVFGATGRYGEIGHNVIDPDGPLCGCGHRGCLEAHISGPALAGKIERDVRNGAQTLLAEGLGQQTTPEQLLANWPKAVDKGDAYAIALRDYAAGLISRCAADAINGYAPDVLILAGYVNLLFADVFAEAIGLRMKTAVYDSEMRQIEIRPAKAGEDALINGICAAVLQDTLDVRW